MSRNIVLKLLSLFILLGFLLISPRHVFAADPCSGLKPGIGYCGLTGGTSGTGKFCGSNTVCGMAGASVVLYTCSCTNGVCQEVPNLNQNCQPGSCQIDSRGGTFPDYCVSGPQPTANPKCTGLGCSTFDPTNVCASHSGICQNGPACVGNNTPDQNTTANAQCKTQTGNTNSVCCLPLAPVSQQVCPDGTHRVGEHYNQCGGDCNGTAKDQFTLLSITVDNACTFQCVNNGYVSGSCNYKYPFLSMQLAGIGQGGNPTPQHVKRNYTLVLTKHTTNSTITNPSGTQTVTLTGSADFDSKTGQFTNPSLNPTGILAGDYNIMLHVDGYLDRQLVKPNGSFIFTFPFPPSTNIAVLALSPGDVAPGKHGDNFVDIQDYNILLSCINNNPKCLDKTKADLNDDGVVDQKDLDLLQASFGNLGESFSTSKFTCITDPACGASGNTMQMCQLKCTINTTQ